MTVTFSHSFELSGGRRSVSQQNFPSVRLFNHAVPPSPAILQFHASFTAEGITKTDDSLPSRIPRPARPRSHTHLHAPCSNQPTHTQNPTHSTAGLQTHPFINAHRCIHNPRTLRLGANTLLTWAEYRCTQTQDCSKTTFITYNHIINIIYI